MNAKKNVILVKSRDKAVMNLNPLWNKTSNSQMDGNTNGTSPLVVHLSIKGR